MTLRDYQTRGAEETRAELAKGGAPCLVMPTGSGKTRTAVLGVLAAMPSEQAVVFLAHRTELIDQAFGELKKHGLRAQIMQGSRTGYTFGRGIGPRVIVASVQTLARRLDRKPRASLVLVDEAHHARSDSYLSILRAYEKDGASRMGMTATPRRLDGKGLGRVFSRLVIPTTIPDLVLAGHLCGWRTFAPARLPDLRAVRKVDGDYAPGRLKEAMRGATLYGDAVQAYRTHMDGKRAIAFACGVTHSRELVESFVAAGIPAEHLDDKTEAARRRSVLARLASGDVRVVSNVALFDEGFDCPSVDGIIDLRPTQSESRYLQMRGRASRPSPGKELAIVLDHAGNFTRHGFPEDERAWTLDDDPVGSGGGEREAAYRRCRKCGAISRAGAERCVECSQPFPVVPVAAPHVVDSDMVEVRQQAPRANAGAEERDATLRGLLTTARTKGFKPQWAAFIYRSRFGAWPTMLNRIGAELAAECPHAVTDAATGSCRFCGRRPAARDSGT